MSDAREFAAGNYRYVPSGVIQYSGGVAAQPGYSIRRVVFSRPLPVDEGFAAIKAELQRAGRPLTALCACELRSPEPVSESGFSGFNERYASTLAEWGIVKGDVNPVARSNVAPVVGAPDSPSFYAFCYTVEADTPDNAFVVAGSSEVPEGKGSYEDHLIAFRDLSPEGILAKARWVLDEMERRMQVLGYGWQDTTATQLYTVHNVHPFLEAEIARRGAMPYGLTWHLVHPPVIDMEFEMDCRRVLSERMVVVG